MIVSCRIHFDALIIIAELSGFNPRRQPMLRNLVVALAATAAVVVGGNAVAASMSAPAAMRTAADSLKMTENVQFFWGDHNYCWYDDGWNGPGWYWCDTVSYTHLRAHETRHDLVCRLLLEKKKKKNT